MSFEREQCVYFLGTDGTGGAMIIRPYPPHPWMRVIEPIENSVGAEGLSLLYSLAIPAAALILAFFMTR